MNKSHVKGLSLCWGAILFLCSSASLKTYAETSLENSYGGGKIL